MRREVFVVIDVGEPVIIQIGDEATGGPSSTVKTGGFGDVAGNVGDYSQPFWEPAYLEGILAAGAVEGDG